MSVDGGSGQLETGIGRAANTAPTALPTFTLIDVISGSDRFCTNDIITPVVIHDSVVNVPTGPGLCDEPIRRRKGARTFGRTFRRHIGENGYPGAQQQKTAKSMPPWQVAVAQSVPDLSRI